MPRHHTPPTVTALALLAVLAAGCGADDDPGATAAAAEPAEEQVDDQVDDQVEDQAAADQGEVADDAEAAEDVEVVLTDFAFEGLPASVEAGTRLTVVNEAASELHELVAFRLPDDEDRSVEDLSQLAPQELVGALGEPATVLLAEPGGPAIPAVGDGTLDEPGRYAVMCFIPTGVDPAEYLRVAAETEEGAPEVDGGPPHFVHGMFAELTVE